MAARDNSGKAKSGKPGEGGSNKGEEEEGTTIVQPTAKAPSESEQMSFEFQVKLYNSNPDVLNKPVQAITRAMSGVQNKTQRLAWNAMLKKAHNWHAKNPNQRRDIYEISRTELMEQIGYTSPNRKHLISLLEQMMDMKVKWDILNPEGDSVWAACVLMPIVSFDKNKVYYSYVESIKPALFNSSVWARTDMSILRALKLDASVALYEFVNRYRDNPSKKTKIQHWEEWRLDIHGPIKEDSYLKEYKEFKKEKLNKAIKEINEKSDLEITLHETKDAEKRVTTLQFTVNVKPFFVLPKEEQADRFEWEDKLKDLRLTAREIKEVLSSFTPEQIKLHYEYTLNRINDHKQPKVDHPGKYFLRAIKDGYVAESKAKPTAPAVDTESMKKVEEAYAAERNKEAAGMFGEMDTEEQEKLIARYNDLQDMEALKVPAAASKRTKRYMAPFFAWLAKDTWGEPSAHQLFEFAIKHGLAKLT